MMIMSLVVKHSLVFVVKAAITCCIIMLIVNMCRTKLSQMHIKQIKSIRPAHTYKESMRSLRMCIVHYNENGVSRNRRHKYHQSNIKNELTYLQNTVANRFRLLHRDVIEALIEYGLVIVNISDCHFDSGR